MKAAPACLLALLLSACQAGLGATGSRDDRLRIDRLYPMREGSVWTYDVDTGEGVPTLAITRVSAHGGSRVEISSGGVPVAYELRSDGLYRTDRGAYVLKLPLRPGASWDAGEGASAEVTDIEKKVSTPAGDFSGCVETRESGSASGKVVRTVFCPDVGPVELESSLELAVTGGSARVLARLRGYDFSGALAVP